MAGNGAFVNSLSMALWFVTAIGRVGEKTQEQLNDKRKSVGACLKLEKIGQCHLQRGSPLSSHKNFPPMLTQAPSRVIQGRTRSP